MRNLDKPYRSPLQESSFEKIRQWRSGGGGGGCRGCNDEPITRRFLKLWMLQQLMIELTSYSNVMN